MGGEKKGWVDGWACLPKGIGRGDHSDLEGMLAAAGCGLEVEGPGGVVHGGVDPVVLGWVGGWVGGLGGRLVNSMG